MVRVRVARVVRVVRVVRLVREVSVVKVVRVRVSEILKWQAVSQLVSESVREDT